MTNNLDQHSLYCKHCKTPINQSDFKSEFCCNGCKQVYEILSTNNLQHFYYLHNLNESRPAPVILEGGKTFDYFDDPEFIEAYVSNYNPEKSSCDFYIKGAHCVACTWLIEKLPFFSNGVLTSNLNLNNLRAQVQFNPLQTSPAKIASAIYNFGYYPEPYVPNREEQNFLIEKRKLLMQLGVAGFCAGNTMLLAISLYQGYYTGIPERYRVFLHWASFVLTLPALLFSAEHFFRSAWYGIKNKYLHIDIPISLGILVAFTASFVETVIGGEQIYYDTVCMLIFLLLIGRFVQKIGLHKISSNKEILNKILPSSVRMKESLEATAGFKERFISSVKAGFLIEIPAQSYIPVDGIIESGLSAIDNSFLTGESSPLKVASGSRVLAGARNLEETIVIKALCDNGKSRIHRILNNVFEAGSKRLKIQTTLDRLSKYFVLTVLSIALITFIYWYLHAGLPEALRVSVAILIITCPCALGMAAPLINTRAVQQAAQFGIYLNSAEVFERLAQIKHFYFDKTGTLTQGDFVVLKSYYSNEVESEVLINKICAVENHTSHPIGKAFNKLQLKFKIAGNLDNNLADFKEFAGFGVQGILNNQEIISIGSKAFMEKQAVQFTAEDLQEAEILLQAQETLVFVATNFKLAAIFVLGDQLRRGGRELIDLLKSQQRKVYLLTGDLKTSALTKARELGLSEDRVYAQMEPEAKANLIKSDNSTTCMIGDGINDVAALKNANLGIAVSGGSEASLMFADCFIKDFDLDKFTLLFNNSRRVISAIKKNVLISLAYNFVGVSLAAAGYINPLVAAIFMPISSLSVIGFSLLFKFTNR